MGKFIFMDPAKPVAVWWPVTIMVPIDSPEGMPAKRDAQEMHVQFVVATEAKISELLKGKEGGGVLAALEHVVVGWDVKDAGGAVVPIERLTELAAIPYVQDGLWDGYRDFLGRAPEKN